MAKKKISSAIKKIVIERANDYCEYCYASASFSPDFFDIDHIYAESLGGGFELKNLARCCGGCNGFKYNKTECTDPLSGETVSIFHPRKNYWPDHFTWSEDEALILGITPIGRATVKLLKMNREGNVNLRILLRLVGMHPPKSYPKN